MTADSLRDAIAEALAAHQYLLPFDTDGQVVCVCSCDQSLRFTDREGPTLGALGHRLHVADVVAGVVGEHHSEKQNALNNRCQRVEKANELLRAERDEARAALTELRVRLIEVATKFNVPPEDLYAALSLSPESETTEEQQ